MSGPAPALRLAEDAEGRLADAQGGNCPACAKSLELAGAVLTFAAPDEGPVVPILVHEDCLREGRRWPDFAVLAERLGGDRETAQQALAGAVGHARGAVETAAKALAAADIKTVQAKADRAVEKAEVAAQEAVSTATAAQTDAAAARAETEAAQAAADRAAAELAEARRAAKDRQTHAERLARAIVVFLVEADPSADGDYFVNQKRPFQDLAAAVPERWREHFEAEIRKGAR